MAMCPLCNAFKELEMYCPECHSQLDDSGKVSDFLDPYGHYNDEETVKMGDGYPNTAKDEICPHLMYCNGCGYDKVAFIQEE
ncbi:hypothetical protein [Bacillus thermotolerans]|uniref:hypothetical protein n=1 Tax=Bacillus thermotolerans TaxID=1221996 RepID=UPI00057CC898|nr:hypothetical protein [Bacillus thermotolerans]KKB38505.1 hypothetical protein QY97_02414 [Bacillus thermotolerans]KKB39921.1 hypothetical protein QY96_02654 [Bacillus thermotolerans]